MFAFFRRRRRARLRAQPFPERWVEVLRRRVPVYERLPPADQRELQGHIQVFLAEKRFEGCAGLEVTEEMQVTIAAQACVLLLHRETEYFPKVDSILVYPHAYQATSAETLPDGSVVERTDVRLGESYGGGTVVLSWDDVVDGAACVRDGRNLVLHEFAHQLDQEDGSADGAPVLDQRSRYVAWARVLGEEYAALQAAEAAGRRTVIDKYGATNPAEFFAVITEAFFEKPGPLKRKHPELYEELRSYYRQDPLEQRAPRPDDPGPGARP
ncbi:MAG: zinc-dependent peptidase [Planctomycetota bacterium]